MQEIPRVDLRAGLHLPLPLTVTPPGTRSVDRPPVVVSVLLSSNTKLWWSPENSCSLGSFSLSSPTSSPVYCLRFTTTYLYAALASALHALDFTAP
ncbi:F-box/WD repeat-containing protein 4 [Chelonia mydas]|uniref:F-box/WD repeat-containing protein 4 n=1 Tax=Chelonia mydas TaxID=8469 RepID=M7B1D4_CHEMY|nr:F-box/WD repeat-containing protein 4 [Chelonia mydas]